ncbi:hypothetical protein ACFWPV_10210 [Streptomyces uncialis]|uniref:hypothetical protein n=1 Tax=Streptomyces uncialis TaxID=1048205 RepID=UPI0036620468
MIDIDDVIHVPALRRPGARGDHRQYADTLWRARGHWGLIGVYGTVSSATTLAWQIRRGLPSAYRPAGACDAVSCTVGGECRVYARCKSGV